MSDLILEELDVSCAISPLDATPLGEGDDIRMRRGGGESKGAGEDGQEDKVGGNHCWRDRESMPPSSFAE
jgi:hypothetical protein